MQLPLEVYVFLFESTFFLNNGILNFNLKTRIMHKVYGVKRGWQGMHWGKVQSRRWLMQFANLRSSQACHSNDGWPYYNLSIACPWIPTGPRGHSMSENPNLTSNRWLFLYKSVRNRTWLKLDDSPCWMLAGHTGQHLCSTFMGALHNTGGHTVSVHTGLRSFPQ